MCSSQFSQKMMYGRGSSFSFVFHGEKVAKSLLNKQAQLEITLALHSKFRHRLQACQEVSAGVTLLYLFCFCSVMPVQKRFDAPSYYHSISLECLLLHITQTFPLKCRNIEYVITVLH